MGRRTLTELKRDSSEQPAKTGLESIADLDQHVRQLIESRLAGEEGIAVTDLARQANISTRTVKSIRSGELTAVIQKCLNGDKHKKAAWVPILSRLASYFGEQVEAWLVAAGFEWELVKKLTVPRGPGKKWGRASIASDVIARIETRVANRDPYPVKVGVIQYPPFSTPLGFTQNAGGHIEPCFNTVYADRLIGAIEPKWLPHFIQTNNLSDQFARLASGQLDMVMAVFNTTARQLRGLRFVQTPGWRISLSAATLVGDASASGGRDILPSWADVCNPSHQRDFVIVLAANTAEHEYVRGTLRYREDQIVTCPTYNVDRLARTFCSEFGSRPGRHIVLVSDDATVRLIKRKELPAALSRSGKLRWSELEGAPETCPAYAMSIAVPDDARWAELIGHARDFELFGLGAPLMAQLYATVLFNAVHGFLEDPSAVELASIWKLRDEFDSKVFRTTLRAALDSRLRAAVSTKRKRSEVLNLLLPTQWSSIGS